MKMMWKWANNVFISNFSQIQTIPATENIYGMFKHVSAIQHKAQGYKAYQSTS